MRRLLLAILLAVSIPRPVYAVPSVQARNVRVTLPGEARTFLRVVHAGRTLTLGAPVLELDGASVPLTSRNLRAAEPPHTLGGGIVEHVLTGDVTDQTGVTLTITLRVAADEPVVRFKYRVDSDRPRVLGRRAGLPELARFAAGSGDRFTEVNLSVFDQLHHSYGLRETAITDEDLAAGVRVMGPILAATGAGATSLVAYEHGSQAGTPFFVYDLDKTRNVRLTAARPIAGVGATIAPGRSFTTPWLEAAIVAGNLEDAAAAFRRFVAVHQSPYSETRKPYLYYNSWNLQERVQTAGKGYGTAMNETRMLAEVDAAAKLGVEVFVVDAGWHREMGSWAVDTTRFPNGFAPMRRRMDAAGMKLGLWFDPQAATDGTPLAIKYAGLAKSKDGVVARGKDWVEGRPPALHMCLVSAWADIFIENVIRVARETGARNLKWDGIDQHGCNSPDHDHGTAADSPDEREALYQYQLPLVLARMAEKVADAVPGVVVDLDLTEFRRGMGLAVFAGGRSFHVNNGPYFADFDVPRDQTPRNVNIFFYPGPGRGWVARGHLPLTRWLPGQLMLVHFFPDDPPSSRATNLASMALGGDGLWGDLAGLSPAAIADTASFVSMWKSVRDDAHEVAPILSGTLAGQPEIYEQISPRTGRGFVALFSSDRGSFRYITRRTVTGPVTFRGDGPEPLTTHLPSGHAAIDFTSPLRRAGAKVVFFGARE